MPKYAGALACNKCHSAQREFIDGGYHRGVACETCHGPALNHVTAEFPSKQKPTVPKGRGFCPTCHEYAVSRPRGFPQITVISHNPTKPCIECHDPHDPKPPNVPGECSACHNKIERAKLVSPHALLQCTTCHEAPEGHKITPRAVKPTKPTAREFCGKCHAKDTTDKDAVKSAPRIELATHNAKYLCWECHYAHMPEVRREIK